jgi:hypothetical protein
VFGGGGGVKNSTLIRNPQFTASSMEATLSVCIGTYNYGRYLKTAIESCLAQTEPADEIVVSDNWSTDETQQVLEKYRSDPRIRIVKPPKHLSVNKHYEFIVSVVRGSHVALLHSDDAYTPGFVEVVKGVLRKNPEVGLIAPGTWTCDADMKPQKVGGLSYPRKYLPAPGGFERMTTSCAYSMSVSVFSVAALKAVPPIPENAGKFLDWYWALCVGAHHPVQMIPWPLGYRRMHGENMSVAQGREVRCHHLMLVHHLLHLPTIPIELRKQLAPMELICARAVLNHVPPRPDDDSDVEHGRQIARSVVEQRGLTNEEIEFKPDEETQNSGMFKRMAAELVSRAMVLVLGRQPSYLASAE